MKKINDPNLNRLIYACLVFSFVFIFQHTHAQQGCASGFDLSGLMNANYGPTIQIGIGNNPNGNKQIPIRFHLLPSLGGVAAITEADIYADLNWANDKFQNSGLQFYAYGAINQINDNNLTIANVVNEHQNNSPLNPHVVPNVVNCFIVHRIDGLFGAQNVAGGFAHMPYVGGDIILVTHTNMRTTNGTLAHELGHYFGLLHTFHDDFYQTPCENVTRAGGNRNCHNAGDFLCSTGADPFPNGALAGCAWNGAHTDATGTGYNAVPVRNIMSYWLACNDGVQGEFTQEQKNTMWARANRPANNNFGRDYLQWNCENNNVDINYDVSGNTIIKTTQDVNINGNIDPNARVRVTAAGAIVINGSAPIRIRISGNGNHIFAGWGCVNSPARIAGSNHHTETQLAQANLSPDQPKITISPNPNKGNFTLMIPEIQTNARFTFIQISGQIVQDFSIEKSPSQKRKIDFSHLPSGIYYLRANVDGLLESKKIIIQ